MNINILRVICGFAVLTVAVAVMSRHFFAYTDRFYDAEGDVTSFSKQLCVVLAIVLDNANIRSPSGNGLNCIAATHIDKTRRPQEQMVLLQLLGMNNAEIAANSNAIRVSFICPF